MRYYYYWGYNGVFADLYGDEIAGVLFLCLDFIDKNRRESFSRKKYQRLQHLVAEYTHKDADYARRAINQLVKLGFIKPKLTGYHSYALLYSVVVERDIKAKLLSYIVYTAASFSATVTVQNKINHMRFLLTTLDRNGGELSEEQLLAMFTTDVAQYPRGYIAPNEWEALLKHKNLQGFMRKKNQVVFTFESLLSSLWGLKVNVALRDSRQQIVVDELTPAIQFVQDNNAISQFLEIIKSHGQKSTKTRRRILPQPKPSISPETFIDTYNNKQLCEEPLATKIRMSYVNVTPIGETLYSPEEISRMREIVRSQGIRVNKGDYLIVFATLVELAKKCSGRDLWKYIVGQLYGESIDMDNDAETQKIIGRFRSIIDQLSRSGLIPYVKDSAKVYYSTLMLNAIATERNVAGFFDLCYNIFRRDFNYQYYESDRPLSENIREALNKEFRGTNNDGEDNVRVGSSVYHIQVGLRKMFSMEELASYSADFIHAVLLNIHTLFYNDGVVENCCWSNWLLNQWWEKQCREPSIKEDRCEVPNKAAYAPIQHIYAQYTIGSNSVKLQLPAIRLDNGNHEYQCLLYVDDEPTSIPLYTKRGELFVATCPVEWDLEEIITKGGRIRIRIVVQEDLATIYDSQESLYRDFILLKDGKEELSQLCDIRRNYSLYTRDFDNIQCDGSIEINPVGGNLYNLYVPQAAGVYAEHRQVLFDNVARCGRSNEGIYIADYESHNAEFSIDNGTYSICTEGIVLMLRDSDEYNPRAIEVRVEGVRLNLGKAKSRKINGYRRYNIAELCHVYPGNAVSMEIYSHDRKAILLKRLIAFIPGLDIDFNHCVYYGDMEKEATVSVEGEGETYYWRNNDTTIHHSYNGGEIIIPIPYLRWSFHREGRLKDWHNEAVSGIQWYEDFLQTGEELVVECPLENLSVQLFKDDKSEVTQVHQNKNNGRYKIIPSENCCSTEFYLRSSDESVGKLSLFTVATEESVSDSKPILFYEGNRLFWSIESSFVGCKSSCFVLNFCQNSAVVGVWNTTTENCEISPDAIGIAQGEYSVRIDLVISDNPLVGTRYKTLKTIDKFLIGDADYFRWINKRIKIIKAYDKVKWGWISLRENLKYVLEVTDKMLIEDEVIYVCQLTQEYNNGRIVDNPVVTNPVHVKMGDADETLTIHDGNAHEVESGIWDENLNLCYDKDQKTIGRYDRSKTDRISVINLYKFEEV